MGFAYTLRYFGGIILVAFGAFLTFGGALQLSEGKETFGSFLLLAFFMGVLPMFTGGWMIYTAKKNAAKNTIRNYEQKVLQLAVKSGGYITVAQVSMNTSLSSLEADTLLKEMQERGLFVLKISESGTIVYQVEGMLGKDETLLDV